MKVESLIAVNTDHLDHTSIRMINVDNYKCIPDSHEHAAHLPSKLKKLWYRCHSNVTADLCGNTGTIGTSS
jgi:hypothetical protein